MNLIIPKLAKELAGSYICKIVSDNSETKAEIYIHVLYAPRVHEPLFEGVYSVSCIVRCLRATEFFKSA